MRLRRNVLVSGATGSGKTTLLGAHARPVPHGERIVTVEDVAELRVDHPHVVALEARQANAEGAGALGLDRLVREALRMRPDRLVVGECRGAEVRELMSALNTGHDGGAGTLHANGLDYVPARLEALGGTRRAPAGRARAPGRQRLRPGPPCRTPSRGTPTRGGAGSCAPTGECRLAVDCVTGGATSTHAPRVSAPAGFDRGPDRAVLDRLATLLTAGIAPARAWALVEARGDGAAGAGGAVPAPRCSVPGPALGPTALALVRHSGAPATARGSAAADDVRVVVAVAERTGAPVAPTLRASGRGAAAHRRR